MAENQTLTAELGMISSKVYIGLCQTCEGSFKPKKKGRIFCSDRCRLLHWAAATLVKEYKAGRINGLKSLLRKLCE